MNIAIVGKFSTEAFGLHIMETLLKMNHSVIAIDPEVNILPFDFLGKRVKNINKTLYQQVFHKITAVRRIKSKQIYAQLRSQRVDLVLVLHDFLSAEEVKTIKSITKSPVCIWFPDAISNFQKSMFFVAGYDRLFLKDRYLVDLIGKEFKLKTVYLPQCCNPDKHKIVEVSEKEREFYGCEITNAGNLYPSRAALLKLLGEYKIKLWGLPPAIWLEVPELKSILMNKLVYNEEKSKAFSSAGIVLNNLHPGEINGMNKRTFEIPACGGFQIATKREVAAELFELDSEIVCYSTFEELKEKIDYYLNPIHRQEREDIIKAGNKRVLEDHTYEKRMEVIFKELELQ